MVFDYLTSSMLFFSFVKKEFKKKKLVFEMSKTNAYKSFNGTSTCNMQCK